MKLMSIRMSIARMAAYKMKYELRSLASAGEPWCLVKSNHNPYIPTRHTFTRCFSLLRGLRMANSNSFELSIEIENARSVLSTSLTGLIFCRFYSLPKSP